MVAVFIRPEKEELIQENTVQPELKDRPHGQPVLFVFYQDGRRLTCRISKTAVLKVTIYDDLNLIFNRMCLDTSASLSGIECTLS
ncbi:hypothetical protein RRG08_030396 [Elysia crispata]|uniref:Uncharacterized protein n=1 Tax=Elysia crispata TaxID=231223 RepID=A0AAE0YFS3_9GAST|nr:hypothetical protein RRG08_030396 [Elysia crispata]